MRTFRCSGRWEGFYLGGVSAPVHAGIHPLCEQNDRRLWKRNIGTTTDGNVATVWYETFIRVFPKWKLTQL